MASYQVSSGDILNVSTMERAQWNNSALTNRIESGKQTVALQGVKLFDKLKASCAV